MNTLCRPTYHQAFVVLLCCLKFDVKSPQLKGTQLLIAPLFSPNMYANDVGDVLPALLWVDCLVALLTVVTMAHAALVTKREGFVVIATIFIIAYGSEQASILLMQTHCHGDAFIMVSKCSSLNSILYYIPWMYSCWYVGSRDCFKVSWVPYMVGFLHSLFCLVYETYGLANDWFTWGTEVEALKERIFFGIPAMTVYFHFAFGLCLALSRQICAKIYGNPKNMSILRMLLEIATCSVLAPVMALSFDIPTHLLSLAGVGRPLSVSVIYAMFVIAFMVAYSKKTRTSSKESSKDYLVLSIPFVFHVFILCVMLQRSDQDRTATLFIIVDTLLSLSCFSYGCGIFDVTKVKKNK